MLPVETETWQLPMLPLAFICGQPGLLHRSAYNDVSVTWDVDDAVLWHALECRSSKVPPSARCRGATGRAVGGAIEK